ncbi:carboxymuconolactone decarboxylase family protein [Pendulispora rubella]|uniref:Alkyl hydroperoxide reductase AhpD n=1 Tax=Pendulispora rubella TaxID=2741070 RepID=A0ABZ2LLB2_9BACT
MPATEALRALIPEAAKDIRLNLQSTLTGTSSLTTEQKWGIAIASAIAARSPRLRAALVSDSASVIDAKVVEDAKAAAALMAMNNVYYRFRHMIGKQSYSDKPARLRMNRLAAPATNKADLELFSLAVSAIHGCEMCVQAHEKTVLEHGLSEDQVHDAVRLAATIHATAISLEIDATE